MRVTASGDFSEAGFERIIRCLKVCTADDLWGLRPLATYSWRDLLTEDRVHALAKELRRLQQSEGFREIASAVSVDILHLIYSQDKVRDPALAEVITEILADATEALHRNSWDWVQLAKAVQSHDPSRICRLAVSHLVESRSGLDTPLNEFVIECAKAAPDEAMEAIGDAFGDKEKRWMFRALVFHGLFDAIGVPTVSKYLEAQPDHAPFVARHLDGPSIDEDDNAQVPELADWLLSRFGEDTDVWDEFMMGRHSFEVFGVPEGYAEAKNVASRFLDHPREWVRKWARAEIADMDRHIQAHEREEDLRERE